MADPSTDAVVRLENVSKRFQKPSGEPFTALDHIDLSLKRGEILGMLGRSGSGKSTVLRIAAGLIKPTSGKVEYQGRPLTGPAEGIAVVFQTFALFPWLTVRQNVEAGLDALGLSRTQAQEKAQAAIELIGLDGFESAYPRELSGGMRQRVGFARALVIDPIVLLMDEPFSALDVLTAETLRTDFLDLWTARRLTTQSVLMVTHNIEEAVLMCDRILILASSPGRIAAELPVPLPHPRERQDQAFIDIVGEIYSILTSRAVRQEGAGAVAFALPAHATVARIVALVEALAAPPFNGSSELTALRQPHGFHGKGVLPTAEALHILGFAELKGGALKLTAAGRTFAEATHDERQRLFREHLVRFVPLAAHIELVLKERHGRSAPRSRFELELQDRLGPLDVEQTLATVIGWGRYGELFSYDDARRIFFATHTSEVT